MKKLFLAGCILWSITMLSAQKDTYTVGILQFKFPTIQEYSQASKKLLQTNYEYDFNTVRQTQHFVAEELLKDDRFVIVDRANLNLIQQELEVQKHESFIDGYTVEQGKSIGAEYLFGGTYQFRDHILNLSLYSVRKGVIIGTENVRLRTGFSLSAVSNQEVVHLAVGRIIDRAFPKKIPVVRILEGDTKAKSILVAGGLNHNFKKKKELIVYALEEEVVEGQEFTRPVDIGAAEIELVENENFSQCKVTKGNKEIKAYLDAGKKLFVKIEVED